MRERRKNEENGEMGFTGKGREAIRQEEQEGEFKCKLNSWQLIYILSAVGNKMSMSEEVASQAQ